MLAEFQLWALSTMVTVALVFVPGKRHTPYGVL